MKRIPVFEAPFAETPVYACNETYEGNQICVKRDDLLPFSFGGNKVRKARQFYREIVNEGADYVMTYGSSSSNHCRIIANMAAAMELPCHIISPEENYKDTANVYLIGRLGASVEQCTLSRVRETIDKRMEELAATCHPYFIMGGGHGNPGTAAYLQAYREIAAYEGRSGVSFDYIFHASGTGTTQAGLLLGKLLSRRREQRIVGISIARKKEQGEAVILDSCREYLKLMKDRGEITEEDRRRLEEASSRELFFVDDYRMGGYGEYDTRVTEVIREVEKKEGFVMDTTYVGKAFSGMCSYLRQQGIRNKRVLFVHTGGTPLYFDHMFYSAKSQ